VDLAQLLSGQRSRTRLIASKSVDLLAAHADQLGAMGQATVPLPAPSGALALAGKKIVEPVEAVPRRSTSL
jgi:hypothetical protein